MLSGQALRHQMVLPSQQHLYDYWRSKCEDGKLPAREDIDPSHIVSHLPMVSITEVNAEKPDLRFKMRLAGTGFWELYEDEIQGRFIHELPLGDRCNYWHRVLSEVKTTGRPTAGVTRPGTPFKSHLAQFWIRLPLSKNGTDVDMILGYDHLIKISEAQRLAENAQKTQRFMG